jgi:hypothetical protein
MENRTTRPNPNARELVPEAHPGSTVGERSRCTSDRINLKPSCSPGTDFASKPTR